MHNVPLLVIGLLIFLVHAFLMFRVDQCPYCGTFFRGFYWEKPSAGHCRQCGKLIEFDDTAEL